jgi:hypothetical protein
MNDETHPPAYQSSAGAESNLRLRSVPYRSPYVVAAILGLINFCGAVAILTTLPMFILRPSPLGVRILVASVIFYFVTATASFLKRRHVLCPLCKGTPLSNTRAHVHPKAFRIFPLDYGTSSMIALLFTQTFRCMYCGARFDLLKRRPERKLLADEKAHDNLS